MLMRSRFLQFVFPRAEMAGLKKAVFKCRGSLAESFSYFVDNVACTIYWTIPATAASSGGEGRDWQSLYK